MKFIIILLLFLSCQKMYRPDQFHKVKGIAKNEKMGAVIRNNNGVYIVSGLSKWNSTYLDKKVLVKGTIEFVNNSNKDKIYSPQQTYNKYYIIKNAVWELRSK